MTQDKPPHHLTRADLHGMTPEQIVTAKEAGRLDMLLGMPIDDADTIRLAEAGYTLTPAQVRKLTDLNRHDLVITAYETNQIQETNNV